MRLRGYDEYEVTLGDEMRGERASLGKTLQDAERDLRIKANVIRAIEDCDLDGFPNDSVVAGYVRSYSRYLGLDPEDCYHRFCAESGFRSPSSAVSLASGQGKAGLKTIVAASAAIGGGLTQSRFAVKSAPVRMGARVSLGSLTSVLALVALISGLGYGGYALLQDIQRVGFSPLPEAPEVVAEAPLITPPVVDGGLLRRPDAGAYSGDGVLAAIPSDLPPPILPSRDGPIADLDPETSGIYRVAQPEPAPDAVTGAPPGTQVAAAPSGEAPSSDPRMAGPGWAVPGVVTEARAAEVADAGSTVRLHATNTAWIRVRDGANAVVFEGTLEAGDQYEVPGRLAEPMLRTGNAGAIFVLVGGAAYGPVGGSGMVVKNLSLKPADVAGAMPQASADAIGVIPGAPALQRAAAD